MPKKKTGTFDNKKYQNEYHKNLHTYLLSFNPNNEKDMNIWRTLQNVTNRSAFIKDAVLEKIEKMKEDEEE